jgi:transcriptional regulator with PAS, ATPase and Fis domain
MTRDARSEADTTVRTAGTGPAGGLERELALELVLGNRYLGRHALRGRRLRLGRGPDCHIRVDHESVSREHVEFYRQGPIDAFRDLGSTNGSHQKGRPATHGVVAHGDVFRFGECVAMVRERTELEEGAPFYEVAPGVFGGAALAKALSSLQVIAKSDVPVMLVAATGCGKERAARAIHDYSGRSGRFHALNCATLPAPLAEAELFGSQRGAFTGAERARSGHLRAAHRGTLFLDEVAELPFPVQSKLLRALEEHEVIPLGDTESVAADARLIVATQEPLGELVARKTFRADLFARLAGFQIDLPLLRNRRAEIPGLFFHFLDRYAPGATFRIEGRLTELLCLREWPGNVRELELFTRKLITLHGKEPVLRSRFGRALLGVAADDVEPPPSEPDRAPPSHSRDNDLTRLRAALDGNSGNVSAAARSAGISRQRAYRLLTSGRLRRA